MSVVAVVLSLQASGVADSHDDVRKTIADLRRVVTSIGEAEQAIEQAWPDREKDTADERPMPPQVGRLHRHLAKLKERQKVLALKIQLALESGGSSQYGRSGGIAAAPADLRPLIEAITSSSGPEFLGALAPIVGDVAEVDLAVPEAFLDAVRAVDPLPNRLVNALGYIDDERVSIFLLERGLRDRRISLLKEAGKSGSPEVIGRLIRAADAKAKPFSGAALKALNSLSPPKDHDSELWKTVFGAALHTRSTNVRIAVLGYLGQMGNPENADLFREIYTATKNTKVKLTAIGGLGKIGRSQGAFLLTEARRVTDSPVRKALVYALGESKHRPAIPHLIECR